MTVRLVTAADAISDDPFRPGHRPATGVILGVFCGGLFWLGLGFGIAAGWALWN